MLAWLIEQLIRKMKLEGPVVDMLLKERQLLGERSEQERRIVKSNAHRAWSSRFTRKPETTPRRNKRRTDARKGHEHLSTREGLGLGINCSESMTIPRSGNTLGSGSSGYSSDDNSWYSEDEIVDLVNHGQGDEVMNAYNEGRL